MDRNSYKDYSAVELMEMIQLAKECDDSNIMRHATAEFHARFVNYVYYISKKFADATPKKTSPEELAWDLTQEIFIKIFDTIGKFDAKRATTDNSVRSWIGKIANHLTCDFHSSTFKNWENIATEEQMIFLSDNAEDYSYEEEEDEPLMKPEKQAILYAISQLSERDQNVIRDYYALKPITNDGGRVPKGTKEILAEQYNTTPQYITTLVKRIHKALKDTSEKEFSRILATNQKQ